MDEKYFDELQVLYAGLKNQYMNKINEQREKVRKTVITKGKKYNTIPFREERLGNKLNGKEIKNIEMKDNHYVYGFDENDRIVLKEEASTFLRKMYYFECCDYIDDKVYTYYFTNIGVQHISICLYDNNNIMERYTLFDDDRTSYENYVYRNEQLDYIDIHVFKADEELHQRKEKFYFEKNKLILIQRIANGHISNTYYSKKPNYKKIKENMRLQIEETIQSFNHAVTAIGFRLYEEGCSSSIDISFEDKKEISDLIAEWTHVSVKNVEVTDFPIDEMQIKKIEKMLCEIIVQLIEEKVISENTYIKVVEGDDFVILEKMAADV